MANVWIEATWRQFGGALDMLDRLLVASPAALWTERIWPQPPSPPFPPPFAEFWYVAFHTLTWTDLYLAGVPEEEFAPPPPFRRGEVDSRETLPERPYTLDELRGYLAALRRRCRATLADLTDEGASRPVSYPWARGQRISYLELQLYNLRHLQGHAAELSLFLGQHGVPHAALDWVTRAPEAAGPPVRHDGEAMGGEGS